MKAKSILLIEDEHALGSALSLLIRRMGHLPVLAASGEAGLKEFGKASFDAVIIDIGLPDISGLEVLETIRKSHESLPVLVITAHATLKHAIDSQKSGATAYLNKPLDMEQLKQQLEGMLQSPVKAPKKRAPKSEELGAPTLIGAAACLRDAFVGIARACAGKFPVLIHGPSGSGKSLAARLIHQHSSVTQGAFVELAACTIEQWEPKEGWNGGTVVIDGLAELDPKVQVQLATWLSKDEADAPRVIATLGVDPEQAVEDGRLRKDLYYALKPATIVMPALCERSSDIPALCAFFAGIKGSAGEAVEITPAAMGVLQAHSWPGNVRELKHVLDVAMSMSQGGPVFLSHLPESISEGNPDAAKSGHLGAELELAIERWLEQELAASDEVSYDDLLLRLEGELLKYLMERFDNKPTRLAAAMNLHRGTLRQKLQRVGLQ